MRARRAPGGRSSPDGLVDDVNRAIIEQLQADGRRSYAAMAAAVGLSEAAVRQRVQRLLDAGVMRIAAVTDPLRMGFHREAMVGVRVSGDARVVAAQIAELPEVGYVVLTAGAFDLLVELVAQDDEHLLEVINSSIRTMAQVITAETFVYLRQVKHTHAGGTLPPPRQHPNGDREHHPDGE
ncbi:Lrp/AsnC family transcriptional regulator, regulator for asnA, asnC and gidA [Frankia sp. AiPs1]|uniref:Lrp/AsnC family transcriptional regulator n=1 Tax=Frankia sp. AiPa1 TaxID=573492 RepID=UPI00202B3697|nr:AsnC family transcriptional regulator [Frankia sp. AiPa1]MCL9758406.1 Lrp/AsnC family transcriptional regulator [Frankia sp. AiPa1]